MKKALLSALLAEMVAIEAMFLLPVPEMPVLLQERIRQAEEKAAARQRRLIQQGMEEGIFYVQPVDELMFVYWTALTGIINFYIQHHDESDKEKIRAFCRLHSQVFLAGIKTIG